MSSPSAPPRADARLRRNHATATQLSVILLDPADPDGFETHVVELADTFDLEQPIALHDGRTVHTIASLPRPARLVCHPQPGRRIVFDVDGRYHPLNEEDATTLAEELRIAAAPPDDDRLLTLRDAADALERALVNAPHEPPLQLPPDQLEQIRSFLSLWAEDEADPSPEAARLRRALDASLEPRE